MRDAATFVLLLGTLGALGAALASPFLRRLRPLAEGNRIAAFAAWTCAALLLLIGAIIAVPPTPEEERQAAETPTVPAPTAPPAPAAPRPAAEAPPTEEDTARQAQGEYRAFMFVLIGLAQELVACRMRSRAWGEVLTETAGAISSPPHQPGRAGGRAARIHRELVEEAEIEGRAAARAITPRRCAELRPLPILRSADLVVAWALALGNDCACRNTCPPDLTIERLRDPPARVPTPTVPAQRGIPSLDCLESQGRK